MLMGRISANRFYENRKYVVHSSATSFHRRSLAQFEIISETKGVRIGHGQGDTIAERIVAHPLDHGHNGKTDSTRFLIPDRQSNFLLEWKTNFNKYNQIEYLMSMSV